MINTFDPAQMETNWAGVTITGSAAKQIEKLTRADQKNLGLRLGVKKSGCAGFAYELSLTQEHNEQDCVFENQGAKVFITNEAMPYVDGTEIDYVSEGINKVFKFNNPKATNECGCGESFSA